MALTERRIRYETLIRWHEDGSIGAHQVDLDQMLRDGAVISSTLTTTMPLGTADYPGVKPLSDILGEAASAALARVDVLEQALGEVNGLAQQQLKQLTQASADLDLSRRTVSELQNELAAAKQIIESLLQKIEQPAVSDGMANY